MLFSKFWHQYPQFCLGTCWCLGVKPMCMRTSTFRLLRFKWWEETAKWGRNPLHMTKLVTYLGVVLYIGHASRVMWLVIHNICEGDWRMEDISTSVCCFKFMYMYKKIVEQQMTNPWFANHKQLQKLVRPIKTCDYEHTHTYPHGTLVLLGPN